MLSSPLDYEEMLRSATRLAVPELAGWCVVDVLTEDGRLHSVQTAAADARKEERLHEEGRAVDAVRNGATAAGPPQAGSCPPAFGFFGAVSGLPAIGAGFFRPPREAGGSR